MVIKILYYISIILFVLSVFYFIAAKHVDILLFRVYYDIIRHSDLFTIIIAAGGIFCSILGMFILITDWIIDSKYDNYKKYHVNIPILLGYLWFFLYLIYFM